MGYHVRLTDVREARERLLPIWAENLPIRGELDDKLRWFYCDGPHGPGHAFVVQPERASETLVGSAGIGARTFRFHGRTLRAALFADLAIAPSHRSGFPALALVRAVKRHTHEVFDLGYGFPNAKAEAVYRRSGYRQLGERRRYVRVLRTGSYLQRRLRVPALARAAATVADRALAAVTRVQTWPTRSRFELTWQDTFDGRFDRLWQASYLAPIMCERTSAFLRWRFGQHPGHRYRIAALTDRRTAELRAYAVVRDSGGVAELVDLFGLNIHALDALLSALVPALYDAGFTSASFQFLGTREIPELLARHHFTQRLGGRMVALAISPRMLDALPLADPHSWFLTDLDEDS
jgi:hypothetical protein